MASLFHWLSGNKEWFFSGLGVLVLGAVVRLFFYRRSEAGQTITSGKGSTNVQAGRDARFDTNGPKK